MPAELGDERSFRRAMREAAGIAGKDEIEDAVHEAVDLANDMLLNSTPPPEASLEEWHMQSIADSARTYWSPSEPEGKLAQGDQYIAEWTHPHADKIEVGVKPHMIEGNPILVFPWPNGPDEVLAEFAPLWNDSDHWLEEPEVIFSEVQHPGIPAVGYIRAGFTKSLQRNFS